jgi:hypothetical protein
MKWFCLSVLACICSTPVCTQANAQSNSGPEYEAAMKASMMLMAFDEFSGKCAASGDLSQQDSAAIETWKQTNRVDAMRVRMQAIRSNANNDRMLTQVVAIMNTAAEQSGTTPCQATMKMIASPEAQFAQLMPDLAQTSSTSPQRPARATSSPRPTTTTATRTPTATNAPPMLRQIDSFGFDTRMIMGMGGFLTTDIYPVVLFRDGSALKDITGLSDRNGIAGNRSANPDDWTNWRRSAGKVELRGSDGWKPLPFPRTYSSLPADFRLDGQFRRVSGSGNMAAGGDQSVSAVSEYRFWRDGTVLRGGAVGAAGSSGSTSTVVTSAQPDARGKYSIDGLVLTIEYDSGAKESQILVADPSDPNTAIWLDGSGYAKRRR